MGVINLGLLVDKIKRKLEGAGFIKSTDYASASKAGVVKVGEGLSITEAGVLSAAGSGGSVAADVLYTQPATPVAVTSGITLTGLLTDYDLIYIIMDSDDNSVNPVFTLTGKTPFTTFGLAYGAQWNKFDFIQNTSTKVLAVNIGGNAHLRWKTVIGIKF